MRFSPVSITAAIARPCVLLAVLFLTACAGSTDTIRIPADPLFASGNWNRFIAISKQNENMAGPFRLNATLYYSGKEESQRVSIYFWGNGDKNSPLPLRLDILMGSGNVVAKATENAQGLFIHVPRDGKAYFAADGNLLSLNMPVPFTLKDIAFLVTGRFVEVFVPGGDPAFRPEALESVGNNVTYSIPGSSLGGQVTIGTDGLPVGWTDGAENGWTLDIEYWPDSTRLLPRKLYVRQAGGGEATLIVRELSHPESPFTPEQLKLTLPPDTLLAPTTDSN